MTFEDLHFEPELLAALDAMGFSNPTPIQTQAIPIILEHKDLIACAQTGTGKTAAYLLPIINKIIQEPSDHINTLIIVPTRELAIQIDEALQGFAYFAPLSSIPIYGGGDGALFEQEKKALKHGANILIATPGRLLSHFSQGYVKINHLQHLILDEADRMLDMGFSDDINRIISYLPKERQTLMFSATMPHKIRELAKRVQKNPEQINIALSKPAEGILQGAYVVNNSQKIPLLKTLLQGKKIDSILIFASTKDKVKILERELKALKFNVSAIHSDLEQERRNEVLREFKNKQLQILVATDILSRGIDIDSIGLVINYDVPGDAEDYIHRVGRTARAASTGVALTFINIEDQGKFKKIEELIGDPVKKIPLPPGMGDGPEYNPEKNKGKSTFGKKPFRKAKGFTPRK
ncbi:MAG TPA: DEAD/DEAH box helicase [Saprospiraceae bacterium]|nr:DEAD/DEAH box helicase [Saprospiraceae bacterium]